MAHFARTRAFGLWLTSTDLLASELEDLDAKTFAALNGDGGGTYAPSSTIIIGGSGLQVTGALDSTGAATFVGITVSGATVLNGDVELGNAGGDTITVNGQISHEVLAIFNDEAEFNGLLDVNGVADFADAVQFNADVAIGNAAGDTLQVTATSTFSSAVSLNGNVAINNPVTLGSDASIAYRTVIGADANTTYNVNAVDHVWLSNAILSADRDYTLADGTATGQRMRITNMDPAWQVTVKRADTSNIGVLQSITAGRYSWIDVVWISGAWQLAAFHYGA